MAKKRKGGNNLPMENSDLTIREKKITQTSLIGIAGNLLLVAGKAFVGFLSGSMAIVMDAVNNLTDALSSIVTMIGTKIAARKPDKKHPYGHGRTEYLASMVVGVIVLFAGAMAVYEAVKGIIADPTGSNPPVYEIPMLIIIGVAIGVKVFLGLFFRKRGKKYKSDALVDSGVDALFDALLSLSTLVGALISFLVKVSIENYLAAFIGVFILRAGIKMLIQSYSLLIGERAEKEDTQKLRRKIASYEGVRGVYDLLLHNYGPSRSMASAHIEVDDKMTAKEIHELTRRITGEVYADTGIILTLGIYSSGDSSPLAKRMKDDLIRIAKGYSHILQLHGFYLLEDQHFVSVDIILDFDEKEPMKVFSEIKEKFKSIYPEFTLYIVQDFDFAD